MTQFAESGKNVTTSIVFLLLLFHLETSLRPRGIPAILIEVTRARARARRVQESGRLIDGHPRRRWFPEANVTGRRRATGASRVIFTFDPIASVHGEQRSSISSLSPRDVYRTHTLYHTQNKYRVLLQTTCVCACECIVYTLLRAETGARSDILSRSRII